MHWTYKQCQKEDVLHQGDILERNDELISLFRNVHPHFEDVKYRGFLVLTQNCDLIPRPKCNATHINLSVIRSMSDLITDVLKEKFGCLAPGIYRAYNKKYVEMLISRIINQNEQGLGLFYLHPDADVGIPVRSVAILRVSIAVRADEHYEVLRHSRVGALNESFQSRLGWIVGNMYSRVAVPDWKEQPDPDEEQILIKELLRFNYDEPIWISTKTEKRIKRNNHKLEELNPVEIEKIISEYREPSSREKAISRIIELCNKFTRLESAKFEQFKATLNNDEQLNSLLSRLDGIDNTESKELINCSD